MKTKISITDFGFRFEGRGRYTVTFFSLATKRAYTCTTTNMPLIDATKNAETPKIKDLEELKRICKSK